MAVQWQRDLPIAKESVVNPTRTEVELFRSARFINHTVPYQIVVTASWGDCPKNGSNSFYCKHKVVVEDTDRESDHVCVEDAPNKIRASIPGELIDLLKWNGCHPFGPWYYIENTVFSAGDKDCNGLLAGERKQIKNGKSGQPCWHLVGIGPDGEEIPTYKLNLTHDGECPTSQYRLEWRSWDRIGEGKERNLDAARDLAIWPDATNAQLCSPELPALLQARLPALLVEFRAVVEGLGFTW